MCVILFRWEQNEVNAFESGKNAVNKTVGPCQIHSIDFNCYYDCCFGRHQQQQKLAASWEPHYEWAGVAGIAPTPNS